MTELLTPRLRLRPCHDGDLARLVEALSDWAVSQWLDTPPYPYEEVHGRAWIECLREDHVGGRPRHFAVAERSRDLLLGCISVMGEGPRPALGYWYHPDAWGRGVASEAGRVFLDHVRRPLGLVGLTSRTDPDNLASQRVLGHLGFTDLGTRPADQTTRRGATEVRCFALDLEERG